MIVTSLERNARLDQRGGFAMQTLMFDKRAFLDAVLAKAGSKSAMARALDLPAPRIMEMFKDERRITLEEGALLAERFGVPLMTGVSADQLLPVLKVCLRHAPKDGWSDADVSRLAQEIQRGLELLQALDPTQSPDRTQAAEIEEAAPARGRLQ